MRPRGSLEAALLLAALAWAGTAAAQPPSVSWLDAPENRLEAPEGHAWVKWKLDGVSAEAAGLDAFQLEQTLPTEDEPFLREIADTSTFIAGLPEGSTALRVRALRGGAEGPWSETLRVEVSYPSMGMVWILGALGSALLVATVVLILTGHKRFHPKRRGASLG